MKSTLLLLLSLLCISVKAQLKKGDNFIGGSIGFYDLNQEAPSFTNSTNQQRQLHIKPTFCYLLNERMVLGGTLGYGRRRYEGKSDSYYHKTNEDEMSVGAFASKLYAISDKLLFSLKAELNFQRVFSKTKATDSNNWSNKFTDHYYNLTTTLSPEILFFQIVHSRKYWWSFREI